MSMRWTSSGIASPSRRRPVPASSTTTWPGIAVTSTHEVLPP
jgi:hypothetical protein